MVSKNLMFTNTFYSEAVVEKSWCDGAVMANQKLLIHFELQSSGKSKQNKTKPSVLKENNLVDHFWSILRLRWFDAWQAIKIFKIFQPCFISLQFLVKWKRSSIVYNSLHNRLECTINKLYETRLQWYRWHNGCLPWPVAMSWVQFQLPAIKIL